MLPRSLSGKDKTDLTYKFLHDVALTTSLAPSHTILCLTFFTPITWPSFSSLYVLWFLLPLGFASAVASAWTTVHVRTTYSSITAQSSEKPLLTLQDPDKTSPPSAPPA